MLDYWFEITVICCILALIVLPVILRGVESLRQMRSSHTELMRDEQLSAGSFAHDMPVAIMPSKWVSQYEPAYQRDYRQWDTSVYRQEVPLGVFVQYPLTDKKYEGSPTLPLAYVDADSIDTVTPVLDQRYEGSPTSPLAYVDADSIDSVTPVLDQRYEGSPTSPLVDTDAGNSDIVVPVIDREYEENPTLSLLADANTGNSDAVIPAMFDSSQDSPDSSVLEDSALGCTINDVSYELARKEFLHTLQKNHALLIAALQQHAVLLYQEQHGCTGQDAWQAVSKL
jgi:hypothetical protein